MRTFISRCIEGKTSIEDIDDWIDEWHDSDIPPIGNKDYPLYKHLGMTKEEYELYVKQPDMLIKIIEAHKIKGLNK